MARVISIPVTQIVTVGGQDVFAPDNSISDPKIYHIESTTFYAGTLRGSTGIYDFGTGGNPVPPDGSYVFYDGVTVKNNILGSVAQGGTWFGDQTLPYLKRAGGVGPEFDAESQRITAVGDASAATDAMNRQSGDARWLQLSGGTLTGQLVLEEPSGTTNPLRVADGLDIRSGAAIQQVQSRVVFETYAPKSSIAATALAELTRRQDVLNLLSEYTPTGYQQSNNIVRVLYTGTQETNKVYTTIASAMTNAASFADSTRQMVISVEGGGDTDTNTADYNLITAPGCADYVHINGAVSGIVLIADDTAYTATSLGRNIISNVTIDNVSASATTTWTNTIFVNVKFKNSNGSGSSFGLTGCRLTNCTFEGCSLSLTSCVGDDPYDITNDKFIGIADKYDQSNTYKLIYQEGYIYPRRLFGRKGADVASASTITLGEGNFFHVTGTTTINLMSQTNWVVGSRVTIVFDSNITVNHLASPSAPNACFVWKSGANKSITAGQIFSFVADTDVWYED